MAAAVDGVDDAGGQALGQRAVVIRMPAELHDAVKAKAAAEERSAAQAMRHALRQWVNS